jgi:Family of unknown function (DUF6491)
MRLAHFSLLALAALSAGAFVTAYSDPQAQARDQCLRFRDMQNFTRIDDKTLLAHTRLSQKKYIVTLRHACRQFGQPGNFYTVRLYSDMECVDGDDILVFRYGGACLIENVKPAPAG